MNIDDRPTDQRPTSEPIHTVWKHSNGHNSATGHPIPFMFGSRALCSVCSVACCQFHLRYQQKIRDKNSTPFKLANVTYCYSISPKTIDNMLSLSVS